MELIYMYIERFDNLMENEQLNFSPNFKVDIIDNKLNIKEEHQSLENFYGENIKNITAIVGKNGAGKTTILDLLGMNWDDRVDESKRRKTKDGYGTTDSYIIVYHIENDYYGIEIVNNDIFNNTIKNFDFKGNEKDIFYKQPMGIVVEYKDDNFKYIESFYNKRIFKEKVSDKIRTYYISQEYSERINTRMYSIKSEDKNYLTKRNYILHKSKKLQYEYMYKLKDKDLNYNNNSMNIEIIPDFDYGLFGKTKKEQIEIEEYIYELENRLYIYKLPLFRNINKGYEKEIENKKEIFILDSLSRYIIDMFVDGVCGSIDDPYVDKKQGYFNIKDNATKKILNDITLDMHTNTKEFGGLHSKKVEYENVMAVIEYYREKTDKPYKLLKYVARYLNLRIESKVQLGYENKYHESIEKFVDALYKCNEKYFNVDKVRIECKNKIDEDVSKALDVYDDYIVRDNLNKNNLSNQFIIKVRRLSEGQRKFLDQIVIINDILHKSNENQLTILLLDELDSSLHPEWSRRFIDIICEVIKEYKYKQVQIVLSSHSPFILSDIVLSNNSLFIENSKEKLTVKTKGIKTFGVNIQKLLIEDFFMDSTIGEFAKSKIESVIEFLLLKMDKKKECEVEYSNKEIETIIENIGEPLIASKVEDFYFDAYKSTSLLKEKEKKLQRELENIREKLRRKE